MTQERGLSLEEQDGDARRGAEAVAPKGFALLDSLILHLNHGTAALSGYQHDRGLNFLAGLLTGKAFNSIWRARQDVAHGYAAQAMILCRSALEDWAVLRWIEDHPEDLDLWLWAVVEDVPQPSRKPPSVDKLLQEVLPGKSKSLLAAYDVLSKFAHPRSKSLRWGFHWDEQSSYLHYGPHVDERDIKAALFFLVATGRGFFDPVASLQERALGSVDDEWLAKALELTSEADVLICEYAAEPGLPDSPEDIPDA